MQSLDASGKFRARSGCDGGWNPSDTNNNVDIARTVRDWALSTLCLQALAAAQRYIEHSYLYEDAH